MPGDQDFALSTARRRAPHSGLTPRFLRRPGDSLAPALAAGLLAMVFFIAYAAVHLVFVGGVRWLFIAWFLGVGATLVAAVAVSRFLRVSPPGWVAVWGLLATLFFLGATAEAWHRVQAVRNTSAFFLSLHDGEAPTPCREHAGWFRYRRWAPVVRSACEAEEDLSRLRRRLAREYCGVIHRYSPEGLGRRDLRYDDYALASAKGSIDRAIRRLDREFPAIQRLSGRARRRLETAEETMEQFPSLADTYRRWVRVAVEDRGAPLASRIIRVLRDERSLLNRMGSYPERFAIRAGRLVAVNPRGREPDAGTPFSRLERGIDSVSSDLGCGHE